MALQKLREQIVGRLEPLERGHGPVVKYGPVAEFPELFPGDPIQAAVLVGLVERAHGYSLLLTRRADTLRSHTGQIALPGGRCDPGEAAWQTALRETEEEIGLDRRYVDLAGLGDAILTGSGYAVTPVVGFIHPGFALVPNPQEVAEIFETPLGFLMDPANHVEVDYELPDGRTLSSPTMTHDDRTIWGVTARILRVLYERLYGAQAA